MKPAKPKPATKPEPYSGHLKVKERSPAEHAQIRRHVQGIFRAEGVKRKHR